MPDDLPLTPDSGWNALSLDGEWTVPGDRDAIDVENPYTREPRAEPVLRGRSVPRDRSSLE
ncbi:hypothetical protein ACFO5R_04840 [Halosolutus amylolyticus]|uniref:Uncharacterized protein n=1 Tax=Halosolutus amylolyticus TaxID=2932267 RepID=A0ABD5PLD3_9EURY|nr:hypothetical protein [Halosolutus amylolyticus]